jgi:hypothetical protein
MSLDDPVLTQLHIYALTNIVAKRNYLPHITTSYLTFKTCLRRSWSFLVSREKYIVVLALQRRQQVRQLSVLNAISIGNSRVQMDIFSNNSGMFNLQL